MKSVIVRIDGEDDLMTIERALHHFGCEDVTVGEVTVGEGMEEVWVIVRDTNVVEGHGMNSDMMVLAYEGYDPKAIYPAFPSEEKAQAYINRHGVYGRPQKVDVEK